MKTCSKCGISRDESHFSKAGEYKGKVYFRGVCKDCCFEARKEWGRQNPERIKVLSVRSYSKNSRNFWVRSLMKKYGVTPEWYDAQLAAQGGHCAICPATESGHKKRFFAVDHDHATGKVRGLLCRNCNLMLGNAKDSEERLEAGAVYLRISRRPKLGVVHG